MKKESLKKTGTPENHMYDMVNLPKDVVLHRVTGDGPKSLLIAPLWSSNKKNVLNSLHHRFKERSAYQGRCFYDTGSIDSV